MQILVLRERTCYFPTGLNSSFGSFPRAVTGKFKINKRPPAGVNLPVFTFYTFTIVEKKITLVLPTWLLLAGKGPEAERNPVRPLNPCSE